jgi:hypothetical protein
MTDVRLANHIRAVTMAVAGVTNQFAVLANTIVMHAKAYCSISTHIAGFANSISTARTMYSTGERGIGNSKIENDIK